MDALSKDASSLLEVFNLKLNEYLSDVENHHMVWLLEIQEEASKMFCSDFNSEPELMPKTPSQKRKGRKRLSVGGNGTQNPNKRRISKGRRSNVRRSSVKKVQVLSLLSEEVEQGGQQGSETDGIRTKRITRKAVQAAKEAPSDCQAGVVLAERRVPLVEISSVERRSAELAQQEGEISASTTISRLLPAPGASSLGVPAVGAPVSGDSEDSGHSVSKLPVVEGSEARASGCETGDTPKSHKRASRSSVRRSIGGQRSLLSIRESMTRESLRRASRRSFLKKAALLESSASSAVSSKNYSGVTEEEEELKLEEAMPAATPETPIPVIEIVDSPPKRRFTRSSTRSSTQAESQAAPESSLEAQTLPSLEDCNPEKTGEAQTGLGQKPSCKRAVNEVDSSTGRGAQQDEGPASPKKKTPSPPSRTQNVMKPHMKSFLQTVQKNQLLMTPLSVGRSTVKSFIKRTTPLKVDLKEKERQLLEVLKKKLEQEVERKKKMEEEKRRKLEEMKRKREDRLRKVTEAREREEQKEAEKKKKVEQKLAQFDEKNDKLREERLAEEKAKRKLNTKKTEEVESRRRQEEEARRNKIQAAEEEERLLLKRREEEELERCRKQAEARRLQLLELERKREQEKIQAQRERAEKEKADALQREVVRAATEKLALKAAEEKARLHKEAEERRKLDLQEKQVAVKIFNVTINIEKSPQSYQMTPKGGNMQNLGTDDYGMDLNSDDSTDDEGEPKKPLPSWAEGKRLNQAVMHQYYNPIDLERRFRKVLPIKLEEIFCKSKPRYFKRTSSAVWHSPPRGHSNTTSMGTYSLGKF
ncbi:inner centromere protein-like isoform X2 [Polyodon spathula]|uniref:inner centromere protein-like isoform X2 n=1 Tax=Polyodon spathula TaxID=7913 RepID=UPI001B7EDCE6|nr:inner centromere protein-like isoform X2 [Polyodon spathula]